MVVGGVVGALLSLVVSFAIWFFFMRRGCRSRRARSHRSRLGASGLEARPSEYVEEPSIIPHFHNDEPMGAAHLASAQEPDRDLPPTFEEAISSAPHDEKACSHVREAGDGNAPTPLVPLTPSSVDGSGYQYDQSGVPRSAVPAEMHVAYLRKELERLREQGQKWESANDEGPFASL